MLAEHLSRMLEQRHGPFPRGPMGPMRGQRRVFQQLRQGRLRVDVALEPCVAACVEDVAADHVVVGAVGDVGRVLEAGQGEQVVLDQDRMRVGRVQPPLAVVVREVPHDGHVVRVRPAPAEVAVDHDPSQRALGLEPRPRGSGDVEALDHHVVGRPQQDHPVGLSLGWAIDHDLPRTTQRLEVHVAPVPGILPIREHEARVGAGHHRHQVTATCRVGGRLQRVEHGVHAILPGPGPAARVQLEGGNGHAPRRLPASPHQEHARVPLLHMERRPHPCVGILGTNEGRRSRRRASSTADRDQRNQARETRSLHPFVSEVRGARGSGT